MSADFLFELGVEELPTQSLPPFEKTIQIELAKELAVAELNYQKIETFISPRRIAVRVLDLDSTQPTQQIERRGPSQQAAFDEQGLPSKAAMGFAQSVGVDVSELGIEQTEKGAYLTYRSTKPGQSACELLPKIINTVISRLPISKMMRWGEGEYEFIRPVHWLVMLLDEQILPTTLFGVDASNQSYGHRFHHAEAVVITSPKTYEKQLFEAHVVASFEKRQTMIEKQIKELALSMNACAVMPNYLIQEVTALVEWPMALLVEFDKRFLSVPKEVLIASMQAHQKCFALEDGEGQLLPAFITISNIESQKPEVVIHGNQKVMTARLSDAEFFYEQDKKQPLSLHLEKTKTIVFQKQLGSLYDKSMRVKALALELGALFDVNQSALALGCELAKCDLLTNMVGEFPELQGLMGQYYALDEGLDKTVASMLYEQYLPRFSGDELPLTVEGKVIALSDRLDTLVGIIGVGGKPTGAKDPFKLRRQALAIIRLVMTLEKPISLNAWLEKTRIQLADKLSVDKVIEESKTFILDRLTAFYQNQQIAPDKVQAVLAVDDDCLLTIDRRLQALNQFLSHDAACSLAGSHKRVRKIFI